MHLFGPGKGPPLLWLAVGYFGAALPLAPSGLAGCFALKFAVRWGMGQQLMPGILKD